MNIDVKKVKIFVTTPLEDVEVVRNVICEAGAGIIGNYTHCTTSVKSIGTFKPNAKYVPWNNRYLGLNEHYKLLKKENE